MGHRVGNGYQGCRGALRSHPGQLDSLPNTFPSSELSWLPQWVFPDPQVKRSPDSSLGTGTALFRVCLASVSESTGG